MWCDEDLFRFANIIESVNVDSIQNVVKTVRAGTNLDVTCNLSEPMLFYMYMLPQVEAVEQKLQIVSSEQINDNLTNKELKTAGEIFLYLNSCPKTIEPWIVFYKTLFQNPISHDQPSSPYHD